MDESVIYTRQHLQCWFQTSTSTLFSHIATIPPHADNIALELVCDSERDAAKALGFTKLSWDNWSGVEPQPASLEKRWDEFTDREREGAINLGWTQMIWDTQQPDVFEKFWSELTDVERKSAQTLGYTQVTWDNASGQEIQPESNNKMWAALSENEQFALEALGFHQTSWDNTPLPLPATYNKRWGELTMCGEIPLVSQPLLLRSCVPGYAPDHFHVYILAPKRGHTHNFIARRLRDDDHDVGVL